MPTSKIILVSFAALWHAHLNVQLSNAVPHLLEFTFGCQHAALLKAAKYYLSPRHGADSICMGIQRPCSWRPNGKTGHSLKIQTVIQQSTIDLLVMHLL